MNITSTNQKRHKVILQELARRAMIDRGLLPDYSPAALAQLDGIQSPAAPESSAIRDLTGLLWASIDNDDSRDLDQLTVAALRPGDAIRILVAVADSIGVYGGYIASTQSLGFTGAIYLKNTIDNVTVHDVSSGLIKAAAFGFIIAIMGSYNGFHSKGGAQGVGAATTNAVVSASILILAANYLLTNLLF